MTDNPFLKGKVPARYISETPIILSPMGRPYFDANGKPLESMALRKGDTLYINEGEARGESWWHDPQRNKESLRLGSGKRVLPEHAGLSAEEHEFLGYEFHGGRPDFAEILPEGQTEIPVQVADPSQATTLSSILAPMIEAGDATEAARDAEGV